MQCRMTRFTHFLKPIQKPLALLLLIGMSCALLGLPVQAQTTPQPTFEPGQLIVQVERGADAKSIAGNINLPGMHAVKLLSARANVWLFEYDSESTGRFEAEQALQLVQAQPQVLLAQLNHHVSMRSTIPNDPRFNEQWDKNNTGQSGGTVDADIDAPEAWDIATGGMTLDGQEIVVCIVDGGVDLNHADLVFWKNELETPGNGIDDDGNGYIDDYDGWDAYSSDGSVPSNSHGTHVSGIAAAHGNNNLGVAGNNWGAKVLPIAGSSGTESIVVEAYGYMLEMRTRYNETDGAAGAFIVSANSSFGVDFGDPADFPIWCAMYDSMGAQGILNCAATANLNINIDTQGDVPTACPSDWLISVTNTDRNDNKNSGAAYGATTIDLGAPGTSVLSTLPGSSYGTNTGTSMATPQVTGAIALMWSAACPALLQLYKDDPGAAALIMKDIILDGTDPNASLAGITVTGGRLNLYNSLQLVLAYPCGVTITHEPLANTKETVNPYPVVCEIITEETLDPDSLFLYYDVGSGFVQNLLTATGNPDEYSSSIPAQSPGTDIQYYLEAHDDSGDADTTEVFFFSVIDYAVLLSPASASNSGAVADSVFYPFTVTNDGTLSDSYNLSVSGNSWPTVIMDASGTSVISSTGTLAADATFDLNVVVVVPASNYGDLDNCVLTVESVADLGVTASAPIQTISAGQPVPLPFVDTFPNTSFDGANWIITTGTTIDGVGLAEPSEPYAARFNGSPSGTDSLVSQAIDLEVVSGVNLSYYYEQTGGGESPDAGDDLIIEYFNDQGQWAELNRHNGVEPDMSQFQLVTMGLPADAYHSAFRLRFRNTASTGASDDWFVDDIRIDFGPEIFTNPGSFDVALPQSDSTDGELIIENNGQGGLAYTLSFVPDLSKSTMMTLFEQLQANGEVNPATYQVAEDGKVMPNFDLPKGAVDTYRGAEVVHNAGGPDSYGYIWIDSDEPGGPTFNWIDISGTGTDITAGLDDDNYIGPFPIGFGFPFYDQTYTEFYIGSNGIIGFGPTTELDEYNNTSIPSATDPDNIIAWCWDDLNITDADNPGGKVLYEVVGGELVISFINYPEYESASNPGDVITAQVILRQNGGIKIQYQAMGIGFDKLGNTVGIENQDASIGLLVAQNAAYIKANLAVEFVKPTQWLKFASAAGDVASGEADTVALTFTSADLDTGEYLANVIIKSNDPRPGYGSLELPATLTVLPPPPPWVCGDADGNEAVAISDAVMIIQYIFGGGPAPDPLEAADADCSGSIAIADAVYLINFIFGGGPAPCASCP